MNPVLPTYKQGDEILLNGVLTTVLSWPAENVGPFTWEQIDARSQASTRGTSWVEVEDIVATGNTVAVSIETPVVTGDDLAEEEVIAEADDQDAA